MPAYGLNRYHSLAQNKKPERVKLLVVVGIYAPVLPMLQCLPRHFLLLCSSGGDLNLNVLVQKGHYESMLVSSVGGKPHLNVNVQKNYHASVLVNNGGGKKCHNL